MYEGILIPRIMGHEYSGEVVEVGANIENFKPRMLVVEEPIYHCRTCFQCLIGQENVRQKPSSTRYVVRSPRQ